MIIRKSRRITASEEMNTVHLAVGGKEIWSGNIYDIMDGFRKAARIPGFVEVCYKYMNGFGDPVFPDSVDSYDIDEILSWTATEIGNEYEEAERYDEFSFYIDLNDIAFKFEPTVEIYCE